jgi:hypothetical protein
VLRHRKRGNCSQQGKNNIEPQADFRTRFNTQRHRTLLESRFAAIEVTVGAWGITHTAFGWVFWSQREDQQNTIASAHPHCPKRPAANHVIKTRAGVQLFFDNRRFVVPTLLHSLSLRQREPEM